MGLIQRWRVNRAAKRYATALGPALAANFGASEFYNIMQIKSAVTRLKLDADYLCLAYAAFLPEVQFTAEVANLPIKLAYDEARKIYKSYLPHGLSSASAEAAGEIQPTQM